MISYREYQGLLADWVFMVAEQVLESGFPQTTTLHRCIELGAQGAAIRSGKRVEIKYWPNHKLIMVNNAIKNISKEEQDILLMKRVLGNSYAEIGREYKLSKWAIMKRMNKIEDKIYRLLQ